MSLKETFGRALFRLATLPLGASVVETTDPQGLQVKTMAAGRQGFISTTYELPDGRHGALIPTGSNAEVTVEGETFNVSDFRRDREKGSRGGLQIQRTGQKASWAHNAGEQIVINSQTKATYFGPWPTDNIAEQYGLPIPPKADQLPVALPKLRLKKKPTKHVRRS